MYKRVSTANERNRCVASEQSGCLVRSRSSLIHFDLISKKFPVPLVGFFFVLIRRSRSSGVFDRQEEDFLIVQSMGFGLTGQLILSDRMYCIGIAYWNVCVQSVRKFRADLFLLTSISDNCHRRSRKGIHAINRSLNRKYHCGTGRHFASASLRPIFVSSSVHFSYHLMLSTRRW